MKKYIISAVFLALSIATYCLFDGDFTDYRMSLVTFFELAFLAMAIGQLLPKKEMLESKSGKRKLSKSTIISILLCIVLMPITVLLGGKLFGDRRYYVTSLLLILEIMLPFFMAFEGKKPKAEELVIISVLCAIAVLGRCAFYTLSQFKPTLAVVIIVGTAFGGEVGFLVGAISAFVSNMFFGQGPWTPWQMLATGVVGLFAGVIFKSLNVKKSRIALCVYGGLATILLYGGILNPASVIMYQPEVTLQEILTFYISGLPFDLIHAESTVFFLWLIAVPMLNSLDRVKSKYGIME